MEKEKPYVRLNPMASLSYKTWRGKNDSVEYLWNWISRTL